MIDYGISWCYFSHIMGGKTIANHDIIIIDQRQKYYVEINQAKFTNLIKSNYILDTFREYLHLSLFIDFDDLKHLKSQQ